MAGRNIGPGRVEAIQRRMAAKLVFDFLALGGQAVHGNLAHVLGILRVEARQGRDTARNSRNYV
jgi:hypothetical protein